MFPARWDSGEKVGASTSGSWWLADMDIQAICQALRAKDFKDRLKGFMEAEAYLDSEFIDSNSVPELVDALIPALSDSNPKFVQGGLGMLIALIEVMGEDLAPYTAGVWTPLVERLGDAKTANRERAVDLAVALSTLVVPAAQALERIRPAWEHKNWRARESSLLWFGRVLASHASPSTLDFPLKGMVPMMAKALEDREPPVREAACISIEQMLRHQGACHRSPRAPGVPLVSMSPSLTARSRCRHHCRRPAAERAPARQRAAKRPQAPACPACRRQMGGVRWRPAARLDRLGGRSAAQ